ncbi:hypothetical protein INT45_004590 [Circinella minor]|uniref:BZIP domain-containing protein n=1 Tax=Circinella minor TaxID=1195481 RepID=A0A8H7VG34_9FUNG|nr:hypothetical protein INT45_004590 [Circinella minor]
MTTSSTTPMGTDALLSAITLTHPYLLQQDQLSQLLDLSNAATPVTTPTTTTTTMTTNNQLQASNNFMIDDWLADELQHSGLLTQQQHDLSITTTPTSFSCSSDVSTPPSSLLPQSPPLTASPVKETHQHHQQSSSPGVSLFPDIWPTSNAATTAVSVPVVKQQPIAVRPVQPQPQQQQQQRPRPVPIMPKTTEMSMSSPSTPTPQVVGGKRKASSALLSDKEQDDIALKRQRNTDAARRSRLKKLLKMESLENRVTELEGENTRLTTRVAVLESEKSGLESKDKEMQERIRVLEEQLAEAHKALTSKCSH